MKYQRENFGGNYEFRCLWHDQFLVDPHLHEYSEFLYVKSGAAEVFVNGKPYRIPEKHLLFIPPNFVHGYTCRDTRVLCAVFSNDLIPLVLKETGNRRLIPTPVEVSALSGLIESLAETDRKNTVFLCGCLHLIGDQVIRQSAFESSQASDGLLYQKVISYLSAHYTENITLKGVAQRFGYNEKYLSHTLHELTGINFRSLLSLYRIDRAKALLNDPNCSMADIAYQSGFSAVNTFNRTFKSFTGLTPSQYRDHKV